MSCKLFHVSLEIYWWRESASRRVNSLEIKEDCYGWICEFYG
jgi:hypothetical protein